MIKFTLVSTKGGVGKTTLAANLGALMADMGLRVLLIDSDIQASLSKYFPILQEAPFGLTKVITSGMVTPDCISRTAIEGLDIVRSDDSEKTLQSWLMFRIDRGDRLANALQSPCVSEDYYDCIVIDTQGSPSCPIRDAAALAADQIIIPINPDTMSSREFYDGTMDMFAKLEPNSRYRLGPIKTVIYKKKRTRDAKTVEETFRSDFSPKNLTQSIKQDFIKMGGRVTVLNTTVPDAKAYTESVTLGMPAHRHEVKRDGSMPSAFETMHALLWELVPNLEGMYANTSADNQQVEGDA